jgi:acyl-CoA synthetase (AMP-forming)/AMP-acid ligase II
VGYQQPLAAVLLEGVRLVVTDIGQLRLGRLAGCRCSVYYGMGNMARALLEHEDHPGRRLGAMRTGLTIGPPEDIAMTIEALGAAALCNVYGSTETYGNCAVTDADDPLALRLHSQGSGTARDHSHTAIGGEPPACRVR